VDEINQIGHLRLFVLTMTMKMSVVATVRGNRHWVARARPAFVPGRCHTGRAGA
jgi:hypothetical protein